MSIKINTRNVILEIKNLDYQINNKTILENINFNVKQGDYLALLGPNGGGKTTLIKLILKIIQAPSQANKPIIIGNEVIIGYVPQRINSAFNELVASGRELLTTGIIFKLKDFNNLVNQFQLQALLPKNVNILSGGQFQKLLIARAILSKANLLILDEPTTGIDSKTREEFWKILADLNKNNNISIIIISHDISEVTSQVHRVIFLDKQIQCYHNVGDFLVSQDKNKTNLIHHHV